MTRPQALAVLKAEFYDAATELGWTFSDAADEGRYAPALDAAFRDLGIPESDLPVGVWDDTPRLLDHARYHALGTFVRAFALAVDASGGDPGASKKYSQRAASYRALWEEARATIAARDNADTGWETGYLATPGGETHGEYI